MLTDVRYNISIYIYTMELFDVVISIYIIIYIYIYTHIINFAYNYIQLPW